MVMYARNHITPDRALGGWQMNRSLRWEGTTGSSGSYLYRSGSSPTGGGKYSYSSWIKRGAISYQTCLWGAGGGSQTNTHAEGIYITGDDQIALIYRGAVGGGSVGWYAYSSAKLRDTTSWMHVMLTYDNSQSGIANKIKYYFNGVEISYGGGVGSPGDLEYVNKSGVTQYIGRMDQGSGPGYARVYQAETHVADGYIWTPSDFGYTDAHTGQWRPKRPEDISVNYGNNGFYLDYADNTSTSTIGIDRSGNSNNWTASGFSVSAGADNDSLEDTPTNNFCVLNPLDKMGTVTASEGNLKVVINGDNASLITGSFGVSSGKWYYEAVADTAGAGFVGWIRKDVSTYTSYPYQQGGSLLYFSQNGSRYKDGDGGASYGASYTDGDIIGCAINLDDNEVTWYKNNASQGTISINAGTYNPNATTGGSSATFTFNFGQRAFSYTPPTGYRALNSKNLATPVAAEITRPKRHHDTLLYTGNATSGRSISGLEFKPDFIWIKNRDATYYHNLSDTVRGITRSSNSNASDAEVNYSNISAVHDHGFVVGSAELVNKNSQNIVAWCWKAGGSSNTFNVNGTGYATAAAAGLDDGTISLTGASVNTEAGFSIVTYDGTDSGSSQTIPHGLNKPPEFWMWKCRSSSSDWVVYTTAIDGGSDYLRLNANSAAGSGVSPWDTLPTSSLITVGTNNTDTCNAGDTYVLYSWHSVPGYSKIATYRGNGSNDGVYVECGFKPAWLLIKRSDSGDTKSWRIVDNARNPNNDGSMKRIYPDLTEAEYGDSGGTTVDWLSRGFKHRASTHDNVSGATYLYMAFAEKPSGTVFGLDANAH